MKKIFFTITLLFLSGTLLFSQDDYDDLLIIKADGNWDKLIRKAESYTLAGKTKKEAEPYYYLTYGLYKISLEADRPDKYKNAYKESFTSVGKMLRYDKSGEVASKYSEFLDELKLSLLELIQNDLDNEDYRRAFGSVMRMYKFGRDYAPAYYLEAPMRYRNQDASTARLKWEDGDKLLKNLSPSDLTPADKEILMTGFFQSALVLKDNLQKDRAKEIMKMGEEYFKNSERWADYYDEIMN